MQDQKYHQIIGMLLSMLGSYTTKFSILILKPNDPQLVSDLIKLLLKSLDAIHHDFDDIFLTKNTNKDFDLHALHDPVQPNDSQKELDQGLNNNNYCIGINKVQQNFDPPSSSTGGYDMPQNSWSNSNPSNAVGEIGLPMRSYHIRTDTQNDKGKGFAREFPFAGNASCSESDMSSHGYTFNHGSCSASMHDCDDTMGYASATLDDLLWDSPVRRDSFSMAYEDDFVKEYTDKNTFFADFQRKAGEIDNLSSLQNQVQQIPSSTDHPTHSNATACASPQAQPESPTNSTKSNMALTSNVNPSSALLEWSLKSNHLRSDALPILKEDLENDVCPRLSDNDKRELLTSGVLNFVYEIDSTHRYTGYIERQPQGKGKIHLTRLRSFYRKVKAERQDRLALFMSSNDPLSLQLRFVKVHKQKKKMHDSSSLLPSSDTDIPDSTW